MMKTYLPPKFNREIHPGAYNAKCVSTNALESLRGNRLHLRGVGLTDTGLEILGVKDGRRLI